MKRYFDLPETKQILMVEVEVGSPAALATPEHILTHFKQTGTIREIEHTEYTKLKRKYGSG